MTKDSLDEILYPERPDVVVDGEKIDHKKQIQGKSLEVYQYLAEHPGSHGVREIQRALDYSSPSVVYYHLNKLLDLRYVSQDDESKYFVEKDDVDLGNVGTHVRFLEYWIPRSFIYGFPLLGLFIVSTIYLVLEVTKPVVWYLTVAPILLILIVTLGYDSVKLSRKLVQN